MTAGFVVAFVASACAGRSIRTDDDGDDPPTDDDFGSGGSIGSGGSGNTAGVTAGGSFPTGGTPATGGAFPMGGTSTNGGSTPAGGSIAIGGTAGVSPMGGTFPCDESDRPGGIPHAGASGSGGAGAPNSDPICKGIRSNSACAIEGAMCPNLSCGLADSGRRQCNCATTWTCTACDYTNSPFRDRPDCIHACPAEAADEVPCTQLNAVCGPVGAEYCACYQDATDGLIWDCDRAPASWN